MRGLHDIIRQWLRKLFGNVETDFEQRLPNNVVNVGAGGGTRRAYVHPAGTRVVGEHRSHL